MLQIRSTAMEALSEQKIEFRSPNITIDLTPVSLGSGIRRITIGGGAVHRGRWVHAVHE